MGTVVGLFNTYTDAERAVELLDERGFDRGALSVVAQETAVAERLNPMDGPDDPAEDAGEGAMIGGLAGLLAGVGALMIPGVGPLFVAGPLASVIASTLAGATAGAVTGGLLGSLTDLGIPEAEAQAYTEGIRSGGVLVSVRTDREAEARDILRTANAVDVGETVVSTW